MTVIYVVIALIATVVVALAINRAHYIETHTRKAQSPCPRCGSDKFVVTEFFDMQRFNCPECGFRFYY